MQRKKDNNKKAATQPQQPLYKGTVKVAPSTKHYVTLREHIELRVKYMEVLEERKALIDAQDCNQTKCFLYQFTDYQPYERNNTIALN